MFDSFMALSFRERALVGIALLAGSLMLAYVYLWEPKMTELRLLRDTKVPQAEQTLAWVKQALSRKDNQVTSAREKIIEGPLLTVVEQTAEKAHVRTAIRRMQPSQTQSVKIWMDEVPFDNWMVWIDMLRAQNVVVERASVVRNTPGLVTVRVTLARH
jgi:type II secretory pathway component PulM